MDTLDAFVLAIVFPPLVLTLDVSTKAGQLHFPITDEDGDDLWAKMDVSGQMDVLFVELITGAKDMPAFDEWLARWEEGGDLHVIEERMNDINLKFQ